MNHPEIEKYPVPSGYCDFILETLIHNPGMKAREAQKIWEEEKKPNLTFAECPLDSENWF